jgi:3D (Asp-Asp-Asp) domain-containing protein
MKCSFEFIDPPQPRLPLWIIPAVIAMLLIIFVVMALAQCPAPAEWKITAYCACSHCCGKSDGITASGKKAQYGYVACNWLPFGTKVMIVGLGEFTVMDRGAKSLFGSKKNHIKHLDVYMPTHKQAKIFGVRYAKVEVAK